MGRVQGGARAAFATPSWGPARMKYFFLIKIEASSQGRMPYSNLPKPPPIVNFIVFTGACRTG